MEPIFLIDFSEDVIKLIGNYNSIPSVVKSQLYFFGFKKVGANELISSKNNIADTLSQLNEYLQSENLFFTLSENAKLLANQIIEDKEAFKKSAKLASDFKGGNVNDQELIELKEYFQRKIKRRLKDHQLKAVYHHLLLGNAANFSVPGSGKTSVILATYMKLRDAENLKSIFVVGPPSCFSPWINEYEETIGKIPDFRVLAGGDSKSRKLEYYAPSDKVGELYLTTYQTLLNDIEDIRLFFNSLNKQVMLVIDEAHYMKQLNGEWANAILSLSKSVSHKYILTGTPMPRSFTDFFNYFDFLYPDSSPIEYDLKVKVELLEKNKQDQEIISLYKEKVSPFFYRVKKNELGLLPAIFHGPIKVKMNTYERIVYDAIITKIKEYSQNDYLQNYELVERLVKGRMIRLRQCVSYTKLLSSAIDDYDENIIDEKNLSSIVSHYDDFEKPAKMVRLLDFIKVTACEKLKLIIWSNFRETLKMIKREVINLGINCELIFGDTPTVSTNYKDEKTRDQIREEFIAENSGLDILVANPAACAESISLHKTCFNALYYDLSYNCAQYLQSLDRIHRVGGSEKKLANYYFLEYENSIDQDIRQSLEEKASKMYRVIEDDYVVYPSDMYQENEEIEAYNRMFKKI